MPWSEDALHIEERREGAEQERERHAGTDCRSVVRRQPDQDSEDSERGEAVADVSEDC